MQHTIYIDNDVSFEYVVSQLVITDKILSVVDGYRLFVYSDKSEIPKSLQFDFLKHNPSINTTEYHYICKNTDEKHAFFCDILDISSNNETKADGNYIGKVIEVKTGSNKVAVHLI